jgi:hypothetical protein
MLDCWLPTDSSRLCAAFFLGALGFFVGFEGYKSSVVRRPTTAWDPKLYSIVYYFLGLPPFLFDGLPISSERFESFF